jgi:hypothetical protein
VNSAELISIFQNELNRKISRHFTVNFQFAKCVDRKCSFSFVVKFFSHNCDATTCHPNFKMYNVHSQFSYLAIIYYWQHGKKLFFETYLKFVQICSFFWWHDAVHDGMCCFWEKREKFLCAVSVIWSRNTSILLSVVWKYWEAHTYTQKQNKMETDTFIIGMSITFFCSGKENWQTKMSGFELDLPILATWFTEIGCTVFCRKFWKQYQTVLLQSFGEMYQPNFGWINKYLIFRIEPLYFHSVPSVFLISMTFFFNEAWYRKMYLGINTEVLQGRFRKHIFNFILK